jgi:hypothetical protein
MPFCPQCKYEYNHEVAKCPDCQVSLVSELPDDWSDEEEYKDWVRLGILTSSVDAEMLSDVLNAKEIPNLVLSGSGYFGQTGQMGPTSFQPAGGGFVIVVPSEFVDKADLEAFGILGDKWEKSKLLESD